MKVVLDPGAILPARAHELDAGYDLYSREDAIVYAGDSWTFDTGVHMEIPQGYVGDVKSKSSMLMRYNLLTDGTVDAGYTGSIRVKLFNLSNCAVSIVKGQKIAQLVIKKIMTPALEVVDELEETERGDNGFGSTGMF
jgi:dUTP pyrophosphatase